MPKPSSKPPSDPNEAAFEAVARLTGQNPKSDKNPAAVALGRLGGKKGGKARSEALSDARKSEIARKAAQTRWKEDRS